MFFTSIAAIKIFPENRYFTHSFSAIRVATQPHHTLTLCCKRWGATLKNRRKQTWDVATFRLEWEGATATAMRRHSVGVGGHIFYKSRGGGWVGGWVGWMGRRERKESWMIVLEGLFNYSWPFFLSCLKRPPSFYSRMSCICYSNIKQRGTLFAGYTNIKLNFVVLAMCIKHACYFYPNLRTKYKVRNFI
jgi:hypothetical protein